MELPYKKHAFFSFYRPEPIESSRGAIAYEAIFLKINKKYKTIINTY